MGALSIKRGTKMQLAKDAISGKIKHTMRRSHGQIWKKKLAVG